jgi:mRNA-degrading endonuclease YafQ of YafQ-DinJ toxin-antitoxin module
MNQYQLIYTKHFSFSIKKLVKKDRKLGDKIIKTLKILQNNPFDQKLLSHKVNARIYKTNWSSRVSGDIRIIWNFSSDDKLIILLLNIGSHTGNKKVY